MTTPERTAFVRFRRALVAQGLDKGLFDAVTRQLKAQAMVVKTGTLVDATVIASASRADDKAAWSGHKRRKAIHGFKAHVGADADTAIVEEVAVTPGNANDGRAGPGALPNDSGEVYADNAYRGLVLRIGGPRQGRLAAGRAHRGVGAAGATIRSASSKRGTSASTGSAAESRRSSAPGSEATACGACDGNASPKQPFRPG